MGFQIIAIVLGSGGREGSHIVVTTLQSTRSNLVHCVQAVLLLGEQSPRTSTAHIPDFLSTYFGRCMVVVVVYHVTIVAIGHGLLKKFWPFGTRLRSTHCPYIEW